MFNLIDYIKQYCANRNIKNYDLKSRVITLKDFSKNQTFAPGTAFFYKMQVTGEITNIANIQNPFLVIKTQTDAFEFEEIAKIKDYGTIQAAESDFVFVADNMLKIDLMTGANALFHQIYSAQLFYLYATPLPYNAGGGSNEKVFQVNVKQ